ncbi:MAG TPA: hypothetical protein PLT21_08540, partial [Syntrophales bacterium]|nr:hypothetical protein [Syntrophales bacterium]
FGTASSFFGVGFFVEGFLAADGLPAFAFVMMVRQGPAGSVESCFLAVQDVLTQQPGIDSAGNIHNRRRIVK